MADIFGWLGGSNNSNSGDSNNSNNDSSDDSCAACGGTGNIIKGKSVYKNGYYVGVEEELVTCGCCNGTGKR